MKLNLSISLWQKETGHSMSHAKGLTQEQVDALKELKAGDRLILFKNDKRGDTSPTFTLKVFDVSMAKKRDDSGGL